jgi:regulator of protease activity HflC (stomatin/prohibitin superfamily)
MAEIKNFVVCRHVRAEHSAHLLVYRRGALSKSGRGLGFWFMPLTTSVAEVPVDDRELSFMFHAKSNDFQEVSAQGVITYRVAAPETLAERIDFSIDLDDGHYNKQPLEQIATMLTELAQQLTIAWLGATPVRQILTRGQEEIRARVEDGLRKDDALAAMGLELVSVRVSAVKPSTDLEKALEMPTRESIQQSADEATFQRRALAVEKERAIQENELQSQIELAVREAKLIEQRGANERRRMEEQAEAQRIEAGGHAARTGIAAEAEAGRIRMLEEAQVGGERARIDIYRDLPPRVMAGLAARELAGKLQKIEHLNVSPELLGPTLLRLIDAGTTRLEEGK